MVTVSMIACKNRMPDLTNYLTTEEAAQKLGFHIEHVRRMLRQGNLAGRKVGYMWFITRDSVEKYLVEIEGRNKFGPHRKND